MRKLYKGNKYKLFNNLRAAKQFKRNQATKEKRQRGLHKIQFRKISSSPNFRDSLEYRYRGYIFIWAPSKFSFVRNTGEVLEFINAIRYEFRGNRRVFVRLDNVEEIDHDAVVLLLSIMVRFKASKVAFNGSFPINKKANSYLRKSGFIEYLYEKYEEEDVYNFSKKLIHTSANKDVDAVLSDKLISEAAITIWGNKRRCQGVQRALIELMHNTNNHADFNKEREKHFWLSVHHMPEEKKVSFIFLDFGVGVFKSLENKPKENKFYNWLPKLMSSYPFDDNAKLLELILNGKLHETVTGQFYRGKGLPGIKEVFERNQISNLFIITNDVKGDIGKSEYSLMQENFNGTFVSWELNTANQNLE